MFYKIWSKTKQTNVGPVATDENINSNSKNIGYTVKTSSVL